MSSSEIHRDFRVQQFILGRWMEVECVEPKSEEGAERKVAALHKAMPTVKFKYTVTEWTDEDIPF